MRDGFSIAISAGLAALAMSLAGCGDKATGPHPEASSEISEPAAPVIPASPKSDLATAKLDYETTDKDGDGRISSAEYAANSAVLFGSMDGDGDGSLTVTELDAARVAMRIIGGPSSEKLIAQSDNDGDEKLTLAEFVADVNRRFSTTDSNGDGFLDPAEFRMGHPELTARAASQATPGAK